MSDLFEVELDSGSRCAVGHPIHLVAEGYGLCYDTFDNCSAWAMTKPVTLLWDEGAIKGRNGKRIDAWVYEGISKERCLAHIQEDMNAHRALPFDEERERARLMPV